MRPPSGSMVYWRVKGRPGDAWRFGYVTHEGADKLRMGRFNGDDTGGSAVTASEVEWTKYTGART